MIKLSYNKYIYEQFDSIDKKNIILSFIGILDYEGMKKLLYDAKQQLALVSVSTLIKKRTYHIIGEALENLVRHSYNVAVNDVYLVIVLNGSKILISTGSIIEHSDKIKIDNLISQFKGKSKDELKKMYQEKIHQTEISAKGGAGLGLYDIVIKSENQLTFNYKKLDKFHHICIMSCTIS